MQRDLWGAELVKEAALKGDVKLRPHQEEAIQYVRDRGGRGLFAHSTGTGKTLSSIATFEKLKADGKAKRALVVAPAALLTNFAENGVGKFTHSSFGPPGSDADYQLVSLEMFRKNPDKVLAVAKPDTLIVDEMHRAKDLSSQTYTALARAAHDPGVKNMVGLTGSIVSNHPKDIIPLLNLVDPKHKLGSQEKFTKQHVGVERISGGFLTPPTQRYSLKDVDELRRKAGGSVHYVGHEDLGTDGMPRLDIKDVPVEMTREQHKLYNFAMGKLNPLSRALIRAGLPPTQSEAEHIFGMITKLRQASNSIGTHLDISPEEAAERSPKLKRALDDVVEHLAKTPDGQAILYSNLVHGGARELHAGLKKRGISAGLYTGPNPELGVDKKTREQDVRDFLAGKKRAIVLTPAGSEGLSLNNATFFGAVDSHFNPERNAQAIARARRFGGLSHRPVEQRVIDVRRYRSQPITPFYRKLLGKHDVGVDEWIDRVAAEKDRLNNEMRAVTRSKDTK